MSEASPNLTGFIHSLRHGQPIAEKSFNIGIISMKNQKCIVCGNRLGGRQTHFCSIKCKNDYHQSYEAQQRRGLIRKLQLVQLKGGKCTICGYRKNLSALVFHHADADEKEFKLDMRSLSNRTLPEVMRELDKCILVCANCHVEIHNANLDIDLLL